MVVIAR
jgi:hypothetical protein